MVEFYSALAWLTHAPVQIMAHANMHSCLTLPGLQKTTIVLPVSARAQSQHRRSP